jgi:hypothetical protein
MNPASLLFGLGAAGIFSCRIFLPALVTALLLRFGGQIPVLGHFGLLLHTQSHHPVWFTSDACIITLVVLAALELAAQKDANARRVLQEIDVYGKALLALLTTVGVVDATNSAFVRQATLSAGYATAAVPLLAGIATWQVAGLRRRVARAVYEHLDGTPLEHLLNWAEDAWAAMGTVLLVLFPVLMLIAVAGATAGLALARQKLRLAEEATRTPCTACGAPIYRCAMACPACRTTVSSPAAVGFLGQTLVDTAADTANHPLRLIEKRRCRVCATPRPPRSLAEPCAACGALALATAGAAEAYTRFIAARLPTVLIVSFVLSLVPVLGLITGLIYLRMQLVLPFSQYLPAGKRFLLGWGMRLLFVVLVFFQLVPVAGGLVVPLMGLISFAAYRNAWMQVSGDVATPAAGKLIPSFP